MCLVTFQINPESNYPFILIHNREESFHRSSKELHQWPSQPPIFGGKDQLKGGTWLALAQDGRLASLINHPFSSFQPRKEVESRGLLALKHLIEEEDMPTYLTNHRHQYEAYHFLYGNICELQLYSNAIDETSSFHQGIHSISNTLDDLSHFRKARASQLLQDYLQQDQVKMDDLLAIFTDRKKPDKMTNFPDSFDEKTAQQYASIFIEGEDFGTLATTGIIVDRKSRVEMKEVSYSPRGKAKGEISINFKLETN